MKIVATIIFAGCYFIAIFYAGQGKMDHEILWVGLAIVAAFVAIAKKLIEEVRNP